MIAEATPAAHVLVVDDDPRNRELMKIMLCAENYRVTLACTGPEALELVLNQPPDLVLLDVRMPGMDGYEVVARIKSNVATAKIPIILVTDLSSRKERILGLSAGAEDFVSKPVDRTDLCLRVKSLLRLKAYSDQYENYSQVLAKEVALRTSELEERTGELEERTDILQKQALMLTEQAALLDLAQDAILVLDMSSRIRFWNAGAERMYGWAKEEALGKLSFELLAEEMMETRESMTATLLRDDHWEGDVIRRTRAGRRIFVAKRLTLQRDGDGKPIKILCLNTDVTDRRRTEAEHQALMDAQLRFKDEFLSHVSHELRSPLTAIKQFTEILIEGLAGELNEEQGQYQGIVLRNVHQLQSMIDDLLEVTRLETGKMTIELNRVALQPVAADAVQTLAMTANSKGVAMSWELPAELPAVYADPTRLLQILIILLDNAVKFTPAGGAVKILGRVLEEDPELLLLEVSDTGCGIAPELQQMLFERLFQAVEQGKSARKGLGLGLYICKELVTRQGGRISVASTVGTGSTFSFTLPIFSLSRLMAPLVKNGRWPAATAALLTVCLRLPGDEHSSESNAGPPHEARNFLQRCLLPDLDLLLPTGRSSPHGEFFFVAVFADENGRSALTRRIREQFQDSRILNIAGRTMSLSYSLLPAFKREVSSGAEQAAAAAMADSFDNAIRTQSPPEDLHHEQQEITNS